MPYYKKIKEVFHLFTGTPDRILHIRLRGHKEFWRSSSWLKVSLLKRFFFFFFFLGAKYQVLILLLKTLRKAQLLIHPSTKKYKSLLSKEQVLGGYLCFATSSKNYIWVSNYFTHIDKSQRSSRLFVVAKDKARWFCLVPRKIFRLQIPHLFTRWCFLESRQHKVYIFIKYLRHPARSLDAWGRGRGPAWDPSVLPLFLLGRVVVMAPSAQRPQEKS